MPASYCTRKKNRSYSAYFHYCPRFKTEDKAEINTYSSRSIQLTSFISLTKPLYVMNLNWLISPALYFIKCKLAQKMPIFIIYPLKKGKNLVKKQTFCSFLTSLNVKKFQVCNPVLDASLFNSLLFAKTQVFKR